MITKKQFTAAFTR